MKIGRTMRFVLVVGVCLSSGALSAQNTRPEGDRRHGGFGAPVLKFTEIDGQSGVLVGGRGGWIINGSLMIGGGGYGLANGSDFDHRTNGSGDPGTLEMGYGGLELGYVHGLDGRVHLSVVLLIGGGGLAWKPEGPSGTRVDDAFFVAEPEFDVLVQATRFLRVGAGVSYRLARGVKLFDLRDADLSGLAAVVSFQFGTF